MRNPMGTCLPACSPRSCILTPSYATGKEVFKCQTGRVEEIRERAHLAQTLLNRVESHVIAALNNMEIEAGWSP